MESKYLFWLIVGGFIIGFLSVCFFVLNKEIVGVLVKECFGINM